MGLIERKLMGHGGVYDELGQVATILGTGHGDQKSLGARVDAVRDAVEEVARQHRGAVEALEAIGCMSHQGYTASPSNALRLIRAEVQRALAAIGGQ